MVCWFLTISCQTAGTCRPRSRAVRITCTSCSPRLASARSIDSALAAASSSCETITASPRQLRAALATASHAPSASGSS